MDQLDRSELLDIDVGRRSTLKDLMAIGHEAVMAVHGVAKGDVTVRAHKNQCWATFQTIRTMRFAIHVRQHGRIAGDHHRASQHKPGPYRRELSNRCDRRTQRIARLGVAAIETQQCPTGGLAIGVVEEREQTRRLALMLDLRIRCALARLCAATMQEAAEVVLVERAVRVADIELLEVLVALQQCSQSRIDTDSQAECGVLDGPAIHGAAEPFGLLLIQSRVFLAALLAVRLEYKRLSLAANRHGQTPCDFYGIVET